MACLAEKACSFPSPDTGITSLFATRPKRPTEDGGETQVRLVLVVCGEVRETPAAKPGPQPVELKPPLLP